tara:strand:+ start:41 stop:262 length:222 start_codon:yes stop_codon:yes gene_type:complete
MINVQVAKEVTYYEFVIVSIPICDHPKPSNDTPDMVRHCNECKKIAITKAIKKNDWYCNDEEYKTIYKVVDNS